MKKIIAITILVFAAIIAAAQSTIRVESPAVVGLDERFNVTFIIEGDSRPSDFSWNEGNDFQLVWGPQKGSSTSVQIINGKRSKSSQYTYTYILAPKKSGSFSLASASAVVGGKTISSGNFAIQVVSNGSSSSAQSGNSSNGQSAAPSSGRVSSTGEIARDDLFLRFSLSKGNAVIGEPLTAVLKLYQRVDIAGFEGAKFPAFNGFWSQEIEAPTNIEFKRESFNDKIYNTALLRRYVLIPQQAGNLVIDPAELVCLVNIRTGSSGSGSIFDSFFENEYTTIRKRLTTPQTTLHVRKLPQGAPASFGGGVGKFSVSARLSNDKIKTHEATSLVVTVSGQGNVSLLEAPKVNFPPDMEVYDTKTTENISKSTGGTSGSKTFEYPFIPRSHGDFKFEPIEYSYYDISAGKYVTVTTGPISLSVEKGKDIQSGQMTSSPSLSERKGVKNLGEDIRFIVTRKPSLKSGAGFFVGTPVFWILAALMFSAAVLCLIFFRKMAVIRADVAGSRNRKATKKALRRLKQAEDFMKKNLETAFYEELHRAVLGFASDKLNIKAEDLNKDNISEALKAGGAGDELAEKFTGLLDACDYSRYSPDTEDKSMEELYSEAVELISSIDGIMKNRKSNFSKAMVLLPVLLLCGNIYASEAVDVRDSLWNTGVEAYSAGSWDKAIASWGTLAGTKVESAALYYNIGNSYFKSGDYPKAILNYERALKIDPSNSDARYNLELANAHIQDKIDEVPEFILVTWVKSLSYILSSNSWAVISLLFLAVCLAMVLLFVLGGSITLRKTGFYTGIASLLLCIASFAFAMSQKKDYIKSDMAIIMSPVTSVKSSPSSESAKDLFVLHEGTRVKVIDNVGNWSNIELADGRQGWMPSGEMELI